MYIRPLTRQVDGLDFIQVDATNFENMLENSIESISTLCSLEYFGLGRYGDKIDSETCFKCLWQFITKQKREKSKERI